MTIIETCPFCDVNLLVYTSPEGEPPTILKKCPACKRYWYIPESEFKRVPVDENTGCVKED